MNIMAVCSLSLPLPLVYDIYSQPRGLTSSFGIFTMMLLDRLVLDSAFRTHVDNIQFLSATSWPESQQNKEIKNKTNICGFL